MISVLSLYESSFKVSSSAMASSKACVEQPGSNVTAIHTQIYSYVDQRFFSGPPGPQDPRGQHTHTHTPTCLAREQACSGELRIS